MCVSAFAFFFAYILTLSFNDRNNQHKNGRTVAPYRFNNVAQFFFSFSTLQTIYHFFVAVVRLAEEGMKTMLIALR